MPCKHAHYLGKYVKFLFLQMVLLKYCFLFFSRLSLQLMVLKYFSTLSSISPQNDLYVHRGSLCNIIRKEAGHVDRLAASDAVLFHCLPLLL